jgi:rubrerythrin
VRRRELLVGAAAALVARPAVAHAADRDPEILLALAAREDAAASAHERAAPEPLPGIAAQEHDHGAALRTMLDAFGRRPPEVEPEAAADRGPAAAIAREEALVEAYSAALLELEEEGVLKTVASILASHAQHLARLRSRAGLDPFG